jgi:hypothetical protein
VTQTTTRALRLSALDDVAVMIEPAAPGDDVLGVIAHDAVPFGHKMALHDVALGSVVRKYGQPIGIATRPILAGEHVHSHNLAVGQGRHAGGAVTAGAAARGWRRRSMPPSRAICAPMVRSAHATASPSWAA